MAWLVACGQTYGVEPELIKAVADVESDVRAGFRISSGKRGNFVPPMGIYRGCEVCKREDVDNPFVNIEVGTKALARLGAGKNPKAALKKYNTKFTGAYYTAVMRQYRFYKLEGLK